MQIDSAITGKALSTPQELADAIVELFAHMDGSPAVRSVTANIGNTHSGTLRLVIEPSRRPFAKQQRGEIEALEQSLDRISAPGVYASQPQSNPNHNTYMLAAKAITSPQSDPNVRL